MTGWPRVATSAAPSDNAEQYHDKITAAVPMAPGKRLP